MNTTNKDIFTMKERLFALVKSAINHEPSIYQSLEEHLEVEAKRMGASETNAKIEVRRAVNIRKAIDNILDRYVIENAIAVPEPPPKA